MKNPLKRNNNNKRDKDLNEAKKSETMRKKNPEEIFLSIHFRDFFSSSSSFAPFTRKNLSNH